MKFLQPVEAVLFDMDGLIVACMCRQADHLQEEK
jgi:beta-phosphoglucomutase-like phosphatase (HAD superfamily)